MLRKPELKWHNANPVIRRAVLEMVSSLDSVHIGCTTLEKTGFTGLSRRMRDEVCYFLCRHLMEEVARHFIHEDSLRVVFDNRPFNMTVDSEFDFHIQTSVQNEYRRLGLIQPRTTVSRLDSLGSRGLQVADFVAGAIHRKYERGDASYYSIIGPSIIVETQHKFV